MILAILAVVTATFQPAAPRVGDLVTVDFASTVQLDRAPQYEIVSQSGRRAVVRTFEPKAFALSGTVGGVRFNRLVIPVTSVLKQGDALTPAPLVPPREVPWPRAPLIAIAAAAVVAAALWLLVWLRSRRRAVLLEAELLPPEERFRRAVLALRGSEATLRRWAALADETRRYLAATRAGLGSELTTRELLSRAGEERVIVAEVLRQGDLEKFSPRGAPPADFDALAVRSLELLPKESGPA